MVTINTTEARNNLEKLWSQAAKEPVTVLSAGRAVAVVLSPAEFERLTARRRGAKAGFAKHLFNGVDLNALLETSLDDVFEEYR
jgi:prevent-host-death family protein